MDGENQKTRYHAEVKITIEGREARVNCFADTLAEVFQDIGTICSQFPPDWKNPAKREIVNAELIRAQQASKQTGEIPTCQECGTDEFMEFIKWTDKHTGELRQAWKCQGCQKWARNNGKGY